MDPKPITPTGRPSRAWIDREIERLMAAQGGMIAYRQLRELGLSARSITEAVDRRRFVQRTEHPPRKPRGQRRSRWSGPPATKRITTGVFASHDGPLSLVSSQWRAVLSGPPGSRLGGVSSAVLLDLDSPRGPVVHVVHPGCDWDPPRGVEGHRTTHLPNADCIEVDRVPGCATARTLMDATAHVETERLDDMMDRSIVLGLYDEAEMLRVIDERRKRPEAKKLEEAIARLDHRSGEYRSVLERRTLRLIQSSTRIPAAAFVVNVIADGYGHRPDLHLPGTRIIIECDGREGHTTTAERIADDAREEILRALGYVFFRVTWHQVVYEPERTLERIEAFVLANCVPPVPVR